MPGRRADDIKNVWHSTLRLKNARNRSFLLAYARGVQALGDDATSEARREVYSDVLQRFGVPGAADEDAPASPPSLPGGSSLTGFQIHQIQAAIAAYQQAHQPEQSSVAQLSVPGARPSNPPSNPPRAALLGSPPQHLAAPSSACRPAQARTAPGGDPMHTRAFAASSDGSRLLAGQRCSPGDVARSSGGGGGLAAPAALAGASMAARHAALSPSGARGSAGDGRGSAGGGGGSAGGGGARSRGDGAAWSPGWRGRAYGPPPSGAALPARAGGPPAHPAASVAVKEEVQEEEEDVDVVEVQPDRVGRATEEAAPPHDDWQAAQDMCDLRGLLGGAHAPASIAAPAPLKRPSVGSDGQYGDVALRRVRPRPCAGADVVLPPLNLEHAAVPDRREQHGMPRAAERVQRAAAPPALAGAAPAQDPHRGGSGGGSSSTEQGGARRGEKSRTSQKSYAQQQAAAAFGEMWERLHGSRREDAAAREGMERQALPVRRAPSPRSRQPTHGSLRLAEARETLPARAPAADRSPRVSPQAGAGCEGGGWEQLQRRPSRGGGARGMRGEHGPAPRVAPWAPPLNLRPAQCASNGQALDGGLQSPSSRGRASQRGRGESQAALRGSQIGRLAFAEEGCAAEEEEEEEMGKEEEEMLAAEGAVGGAERGAGARLDARGAAGGAVASFDVAALIGALTAAGSAPVLLEVAGDAEGWEEAEPTTYVAVALPRGFGRLLHAACNVGDAALGLPLIRAGPRWVADGGPDGIR